MRIFEKGDAYRPRVYIKKLNKHGVPTVLQVSGKRYVLETHNINRGVKK